MYNKILTIILVLALLGALVALGYTVANPKITEKFTEFYILGINGKAEDYPSEYFMKNGVVTEVIYGDGILDANHGLGIVTVGIVNHEQQIEKYSVKISIDGTSTAIDFNGSKVDELGPVELQKGQKLELAIGILPQHIGDNQQVDILLFKDSETIPENSLRIFINVKPID